MRVVRTYGSRMDAEIARGFLESAGIRAFVSSDDEGGLHPALGAQWGASLSVADGDFEAAEKVLEKIDSEAPLDED